MAIPSSPRIGLTIVHYNAPQAVALLLNDLVEQDHGSSTLDIVVADNGPSASALAEVIRQYGGVPGVRFEVMPGNLGYYGAAQAVFDNTWQNDLPEWVIVSNADIRIPSKDFCSRLARYGSTFPVIAPAIISAFTGRDQNPYKYRRPSAWSMHLKRFMRRTETLARLIESQYSLKQNLRRAGLLGTRLPESSSPLPVYGAHGSFIIFNRTYFERGGTFKAGTFLFAEEVFVAECCRRLRLPIMYCPGLQVLHSEHAATKPSSTIRAFEATAAEYCALHYFPLWKRTQGVK
jgi:GT2 family glycosyltransferase